MQSQNLSAVYLRALHYGSGLEAGACISEPLWMLLTTKQCSDFLLLGHTKNRGFHSTLVPLRTGQCFAALLLSLGTFGVRSSDSPLPTKCVIRRAHPQSLGVVDHYKKLLIVVQFSFNVAMIPFVTKSQQWLI